MNKNRLEYQHPATSASTQPIWPRSLPPTGLQDRVHRGDAGSEPERKVAGWCRGRTVRGGGWTTLASCMRDPDHEDGNLHLGCPCQETKEERSKCQHLVGKKFLSGTFGKIPRGILLESLQAEWKELWLQSQTDRLSARSPLLCRGLCDLRQGTESLRTSVSPSVTRRG